MKTYIEALGLVAVAAGLYLVWIPLSLIFAGIVLIYAANRPEPHKEDET